ncbi:MAG: beta-N-acetylhexosaminidase [Pseudohongiellaceae bacterium]
MAVSTPLGELMLDLYGLELTEEESSLLRRSCVGGVILFERNYQSPEQLQTLVTSIRQCNPDLLIAVDQEGGRVQRFRNGFTRLPSLACYGELYARDPAAGIAAAEQGGWLMAAELLAFAIDFSFAPVLDLGLPVSRVIGRRGFAASPAMVSHLGSAFIRGMHQAGMAATGKHFPGHGSIAADSHTDLPVDNRSLETLQSSDLVPFRQCAADLDAIMPAHVIYPEVDDQCAGFSAVWLKQVLRKELGFGGVIFSDDLTMAAADSAGPIEQRAAAALRAGCDMILVCNNHNLAAATADWLDANGFKGSTALSRMRRRASFDPLSLRRSTQWQSAAQILAGLLQDDRS